MNNRETEYQQLAKQLAAEYERRHEHTRTLRQQLRANRAAGKAARHANRLRAQQARKNIPMPEANQPDKTASLDTQMAAAVRRQLAHITTSHQINRTGWTRQQWINDARRLMGELDGSVRDLVNGHVLALLAELDHAGDRDRALRVEMETSNALRADRDAAHDQLDEARTTLLAAFGLPIDEQHLSVQQLLDQLIDEWQTARTHHWEAADQYERDTTRLHRMVAASVGRVVRAGRPARLLPAVQARLRRAGEGAAGSGPENRSQQAGAED
jgi:hypothetical protein